MLSLLRHFADSALTAANADLREQLAAEQSKNRILELEQEKFLDVIERDRKRIAAETAQFAQHIVTAELGK